MSSDEIFLEMLLAALDAVGLEAIVVGSVAAVLQGAPVMTQDVDILIRDTPRNREKLARWCEEMGGARLVQPSPMSRTLSTVGTDIQVDVLFDLLPSCRTRFESLRARSVKVKVGAHEATVASLADIVASKKAANRDKDRAVLPILADTLKIRAKLRNDQEGSDA